jgi:hypothetical protein
MLQREGKMGRLGTVIKVGIWDNCWIGGISITPMTAGETIGRKRRDKEG